MAASLFSSVSGEVLKKDAIFRIGSEMMKSLLSLILRIRKNVIEEP